MPQVPLYDGNQVQESGLPNVRVDPGVPSAEAFGGGAQKLLSETTGVLERAKKEADDAAVTDFDNKLASYANNDLFNKDTGALNVTGKDAFNITQERSEKFDSFYKDLKKNLHGSTQFVAADEAYQKRKIAHVDALEKHSSSEFQAFSMGTQQAKIKLAQDDAVTNSFDPKVVDQKIKDQYDAYDKLGGLDGKIQGQLDALKKEAASKTYKEVIGNQIDGLARGATKYEDIQKYFSTVRDGMTAEDSNATRDLLDKVGTKHEGQLKADELFSKYQNSETVAKAKLKDIKDDDVRAHARTFLDQAFADRDTAKTRDQTNLYQQLYNMQDAGQKPPETMLHQLTPSQQESLKNSGKKRIDDPKFVYELRTMAANPQTRDEFKKMNLMAPENYSRLSDATVKELTNAQTKHSDDAKFKGIETIENTIKNNYRAAGETVPWRLSGKETFQKYEDYRLAITKEIERTKDDSPENVDKITKSLLKKSILNKRAWFLPDVSTVNYRAGGVNPNSVDLSDIDPGVVEQIKSSLKAGGRNPNDENNIKQVYLDALKAGRL